MFVCGVKAAGGGGGEILHHKQFQRDGVRIRLYDYICYDIMLCRVKTFPKHKRRCPYTDKKACTGSWDAKTDSCKGENVTIVNTTYKYKLLHQNCRSVWGCIFRLL